MVLRKKFKGLSRKKAIAAFSRTPADCVAAGDLKTLRTLIARGADVNALSARDESALILAVQLGDREALEILLAAGIDLEARSLTGMTALMIAAQSGDIAALKSLIAKGANVNAARRDGTTALMVASMFGRPPCVSVLIARGANVFARDIYGYTALMFAEERKCRRALRQAEEAAGVSVEDKAKVSDIDDQQESLLRNALAQAIRASRKKAKSRRAAEARARLESETRA